LASFSFRDRQLNDLGCRRGYPVDRWMWPVRAATTSDDHLFAGAASARRLTGIVRIQCR